MSEIMMSSFFHFNIVINADDFGMNRSVNECIKSYIERGLISSTSILANGPEFDDAVNFALHNPQVSYGIHLNMTEFMPVVIQGKPNKFTDEKKLFNRRFEKVVSIFDTFDILREWSSQVDKLKSRGINISHIDSHHHIHTRPESFIALKLLQWKYSISKVRTTRNLIPKTSKASFTHHLKILKKNLWHWALAISPPYTIRCQSFGSVLDFIDCLNQRSKILISSNYIEIMCHPGGEYSDDETSSFALTCKLEKFYLENDLRAKQNFTYSLISYKEL